MLVFRADGDKYSVLMLDENKFCIFLTRNGRKRQ